jgi:hypothetical protein
MKNLATSEVQNKKYRIQGVSESQYSGEESPCKNTQKMDEIKEKESEMVSDVVSETSIIENALKMHTSEGHETELKLHEIVETSEGDGHHAHKTWCRRLEDFIWLKNPNYFLICCIHEYCGGLKGHPRLIFFLRFIQLSLMIGLIALNLIYRNQESLFFTNFSIFFTTLASIMHLVASITYKNSLEKFRLHLIEVTDKTLN